MLVKLSTFKGVDSAGEPLVRLFHQGDSIEKVAAGYQPEVQDFLSTYTSDKNKIALLVNALGGSEYWGQNVNGDVFPWSALSHQCLGKNPAEYPFDEFYGKRIPPYGYSTFLDAHPFVHHRNKDPSRAFGKVAVSCLNRAMKRVELVTIIDRQLASMYDAQPFVDRIDAGEFPDVSMGCRVPYDVCTICGHKSKTKDDYCDHVKLIGMNRILDDGRRVGVINLHPRFFDISFVFIGADRTAKTMCKLASGLIVPQSIADAEELYGTSYDGESLIKAASVTVPDNIAPGSRLLFKLKGLGRVEKLKARTGMDDAKLDEMVANSNLLEVMDPARARGFMNAAVRNGESLDRVRGDMSASMQNARNEKHSPRAGYGDGLLRTNAVDGVDISDDHNEKEAAFKEVLAFAEEEYNNDRSSRTPWSEGAEPERPLGRKVDRNKDHDREGVDTGYGKPVVGLSEDPMDAEPAGIQKSAAGLVQIGETNRISKKEASYKYSEGSRYSCAECKHWIPGGPEGDSSKPAKCMYHRMEDSPKSYGHCRFYENGEPVPQRKPLNMTDPGKSNYRENEYHTGFRCNRCEHFLAKKKACSKVFSEGDLHAGFIHPEANCAEWQVVKGEPIPLDTKDEATTKTAAKKLKAPPHRGEYPYHGQYKWNGLDILVENAEGTWRVGKTWKTLMKFDYGEIKGSLGADGDPVDVYVGPSEKAKNVYIIHQNHAFGSKRGQYDEDKVMLGFSNPRVAKKAYLAHYDSPGFFRSITEMDFAQFKKMIFRGEARGEKIAEKIELSEGDLDIDLRYAEKIVGTKHPQKKIIEESKDPKKVAESLSLQDLFSVDINNPGVRRERIWKDKSTGHSTYHVGSGLGDSFSNMQKTAAAIDDELAELFKVSASKAAEDKLADVIKDIDPDVTTGRVVKELTDREPCMDKGMLDQAGQQGLGKALTTTSMMGMPLKPEEFLRLILSAIGKSGLADELEQKGQTFKVDSSVPPEAPCPCLDKSQFDKSLMQKLLPSMEGRSYLGPVLSRRVIRISITPKTAPPPEGVDSPLLSKVAGAYNWYRTEMMKVATYAPGAVSEHPALHAAVAGANNTGIFEKEATGMLEAAMKNPVGARNTVLATAASIPLALMYSASKRRDVQQDLMRGQDPGVMKQLIASHPYLTALGAGALVRHMMKNPELNQLVGSVADQLLRAGGKVATKGIGGA